MKTLMPLIYTFVVQLMQKIIENLPVIINSLNLNIMDLHNTLLLNSNANGLKKLEKYITSFPQSSQHSYHMHN